MPAARTLLYVLTAASLVVVVRSLLGHPPSLALASLFFAAYVTVVLLGVFVLPLRMWTDAICRGPIDARGVVLTFDDGPHPIWTPRILDLLDARGAKATFFVIGRKARTHPEVVREIHRRGHTIGIHGFAHDRLFALRGARRVRADILEAKRELDSLCGIDVRLFRPPIGHTNPSIARVSDELELIVVGWSARGFDGVSAGDPGAVAARITRGVRDGAIVLMHDAREHGDDEPASVAALPMVLDRLDALRLPVVSIEGWLAENLSRSSEPRAVE